MRLLKALLVCTILVSLGGVLPVSAAPGDLVPVFSSNFDDGAPAQLSGVTTTEGVQGYAGLGAAPNAFGGSFLRNTGLTPTTLTLADLPHHDAIDISFLLAIIDSWDGDPCHGGPDTFTVTVDGVEIFSDIFQNSGCGTQSYVPPEGAQLAYRVALGFASGGFFLDSAYDMTRDPSFRNIPHTASTLTIEWLAAGIRVGNPDESWAIENLEVMVHETAAPSETPTETPSPEPAESESPEPVAGPADPPAPTGGDQVASDAEVVVLPRKIARTGVSQSTLWLLGTGLGLLALGVSIRRLSAERARRQG